MAIIGAMRVAMYYSNSDVRLEDVPTPAIGPGEILVKVVASGLCGTDVLEWYRRDKAPLVLGHEIAGDVVEVGDGVEGLELGDRVVVAHHVPCNTCHYCLRGHQTVCETLRSTKFYPGGFAEFVRIPSINVDRGVFKLPDEVSYSAGTFVEPLACVLRAQRLAGVGAGDSVVVLGSGISGILHIQAARAVGAGLIVGTDISEYRLAAATHFGATKAVDAGGDVSSIVRSLNDGRLADVVIITTGATKAIAQALDLSERGGTIVFFAPTEEGFTLPQSVNEIFWRTERRLISTYAGDRRDHLQALELIRRGRVDVGTMVTHRLGLEAAAEGFKLVVEADKSIKVIIEP